MKYLLVPITIAFMLCAIDFLQDFIPNPAKIYHYIYVPKPTGFYYNNDYNNIDNHNSN